MKLYLAPPEAHNNGGIRRVVEAQYKYLPEFNIEITQNPFEAEVEACHVMGQPQNPKAAFILHNHGMMWKDYFDDPESHLVNRKIVESMRQAWAITSPSEWVTKALQRGVYFPIETIHHGIELEEWHPRINPNLSNGYILWNKARVDEVSDPADMNRLAALLPDIYFVSTFGQEAKNVTLLGNQQHASIRELVGNAGLYLATARETFGIGTLEALACGVPVVGWNYGGQHEIIRQGETGVLVPYGDYGALADAVRGVLDSRDVYSRGAVADVKARWQWRDQIKKYAQLYYKAAAWYSAPRPKVTVIVPAHNYARFLPYTLKSIQDQTMDDFECLIIDDQSTDETPDIARAAVKEDIRFRYHRTFENLKLSAVRNYGAEKALGKYLIYVDADDMLEPNALALLSSALDTDRSIHIAYGGLDLMNEEGTHRRGNRFPGEFNWYHQMAHQNQVPTAAMMRREVAEQSGGWRTRQWRAEDAEFWSRVTSFGYIAKQVTKEPVLLYRLHQQSKGSIEFRTFADHDGNWLANIPWRSANSAAEGAEYLKDNGNTVPRPELVPFGAQGLPKEKFWDVWHRQEAQYIVVVDASREVEDTLDSIMGQFVAGWEVYLTGKPIPGFPYVRYVDTMGDVPVTPFYLESGVILPNDYFNKALNIPLTLPQPLQNGKVLLQYVGHNVARTQFRVNSNTYFGAQGAFVWVEEGDVEKLLSRGQWKKITTVWQPDPVIADKRRE